MPFGLSAPPSFASLASDAAVFLDFDGTLVALASRPDAIAPKRGLGARLEQLSHRLGGRCALVSGRAIFDIERHLGPAAIAIAGSHGTDIRSAWGEVLGEGARCLPPEIEQALRQYAAQNGVDYEHKPHGGALHYRANPARGEEAVAFAKSLAAQHDWKAQEGKCVIEIVANAGDKGSAVHRFMQTGIFAGARPVFIGDDLTDEAGFAACQERGGIGIVVGEREGTGADYRLSDVAAVHNWLGV